LDNFLTKNYERAATVVRKTYTTTIHAQFCEVSWLRLACTLR